MTMYVIASIAATIYAWHAATYRPIEFCRPRWRAFLLEGDVVTVQM